MAAAAEAAAPLTHRRVLRIAIPIMVSNATVPILGAVDTGVVGQLGLPQPIGAVGMGAIILAFVYWIFGFLRMGTTGLVAQARGAGDVAETGALLMRALMIAGTAGAFFIVFQVPVFWLAFQMSPASAEVETMAREYLAIRVWGAPFAIATFALNGWLIAMERTRGVMVLQLVMNAVNMVLDLWFVLGLGWGVEGVAIATLIAEITGASLGLWMCREAFAGDQWKDVARVFDPVRLKRMAQVNGDILLRSLMLQFGFAFFMFRSADHGDVALAANQVLMQFLEISAFALDGFAFAAEALVGGAFGARRAGELRRAAVMSSAWGLGCVVALAASFWLAGGAVIDLMTTSPEVREAAREFLPWCALAPVVGLPAFMLDGIFIGATRSRDMRNAMAWSLAMYLAAWWVLTALMGTHGLWAALMVFFVARGVTLFLRYPSLERAAA
ncbi:MATE family efflux transporter [uncultured Albimonas sp.]|uniref:MATE family efflux transporter n=1 Tax=uncultured Albimonas sp. TaxID=1331701 RepID=UPI0030ED0B1A|tara:strand:+ start:6035 stop:7360 length:1326 start_codon:yes stop_codon:yes gene_type:complete